MVPLLLLLTSESSSFSSSLQPCQIIWGGSNFLLAGVIAQAQYGDYGLGGRGNYGPGGQGDYGVGFGEYGQDYGQDSGQDSGQENAQGQDYGGGSSDELPKCGTESKHGKPCTTWVNF